MARPRSKRDLNRKKSTKIQRDRILIVCEGTKSEPGYLKDLKKVHRLTATDIPVGGSRSDPGSIVKEAKRIRDNERRKHDMYDRVFCVFDRDEHANFAAARKEALDHGFCPVCSWPCFEYWILLHFKYSRSPYGRTGSKSQADNCFNDLKEVFPEYEKAISKLYRRLKQRLEMAMNNARLAKKDAEETDQPNPSTEMHELVDYLLSQSSE